MDGPGGSDDDLVTLTPFPVTAKNELGEAEAEKAKRRQEANDAIRKMLEEQMMKSVQVIDISGLIPQPGGGGGGGGGSKAPNTPIKINPNKWPKKDCDQLLASIQRTYKQFNFASDMLRGQLDFQYESAATLYWIDRAVDSASGVTGGAIGSAVKGAAVARGAASASASLSGKLLQSGAMSRGGITLFGRAMAGAEGWANLGIFGTMASTGTKQAIKIPARFGTNGLRDDIQDTVDSLDADANKLADNLTDMRGQYKTHCSGQ